MQITEFDLVKKQIDIARKLRNKYNRAKKLGHTISVDEYLTDIQKLQKIVHTGPVRTFAHKRIRILRNYYRLHISTKTDQEQTEMQEQHIDVYKLPKVDNHIHLAAAFPPKMIIDYFKEKLATNGNDEIEEGVYLKDIIHPDKITSETLGIHANETTFLRFDRFNYKYNLYNKELVRKVFLKTDNRQEGKYFGELTHRLIHQQKNYTELRISIYGNDPNEWQRLAEWMIRHEIDNHSTNKWVIQMPRIYHKLKSNNSSLLNFQVMLDNFFDPIENALKKPDLYPEINRVLQNVLGFDSVDDETTQDEEYTPTDSALWTSDKNPPYGCYMFNMFLRINKLNILRRQANQMEFMFRPHAGESGDINHLLSAYLLADHINHGIQLQDNPALMYLYYLDQIGISMSPTSNHYLVLKYKNSPFKKFLECGMAITLSTDDPMFFHLSDNPLLEEYIIARHMWDLDMVDLYEIAARSVEQSGFSHLDVWYPPVRQRFRQDLLKDENGLLSE